MAEIILTDESEEPDGTDEYSMIIAPSSPGVEEISFSSPAFSYLNPKVKLRKLEWGIGMFSEAPIRKDEVLIGWSGRVVHLSEILEMKPDERHYVLQIDDELFQAPFWPGYNEPADFTNHSCNPNCGFGNSAVTLVAMRNIAIGEELTFDYAMADSIEGLEGNWDCLCGSPLCRGKIRGSDWKLPELWKRYQAGSYFSPYLRRKIAMLQLQAGARFSCSQQQQQEQQQQRNEMPIRRVRSFGVLN